ncbi:uncharacterized protein MONOS_10978 [Monocercomonoides exilis]|uniref:uncharacterized protein n=1 Tax=Monocercomonoides exilis TaxID=2049356 RepID=UPI0035593DD4|nr:hypothetical protein MONOS_10978 [Monocercomonoides exilis]|eukprot:MONOS_10978.1-p1 / transcript=MONOS_10978.1 / gene=MONOS_10978 / organism=Monocercomonoides_exilis_PA203 / gene_product=unspecified product / transcript_product=unspecified product / location=Mono_scaffold00524:26250-26876(+) / protein_length=179 / sequence_SO=supercontig / SO=protein_coding / is_pseudo=false
MHTEKKDWLKEGMKYRYVGVGGDDTSNLCGMSESAPCKTVGHAVESSMAQLSSTITLLGGKHVSEGATISVGEKKIIITGRGKTVSVFGTNSLSSPATTLFSISSGQLEVGHVGIDHNATRSSSPNEHSHLAPIQAAFSHPRAACHPLQPSTQPRSGCMGSLLAELDKTDTSLSSARD